MKKMVLFILSVLFAPAYAVQDGKQANMIARLKSLIMQEKRCVQRASQAADDAYDTPEYYFWEAERQQAQVRIQKLKQEVKKVIETSK